VNAKARASPPKALLRYLAISLAIVLAAFVVVGVYWNREQLAIRIKSVFVPVPPKAAQTPPASKRASGAFVANAEWALSALPECFTQTEKVTGPPKYVLAQLPQGASMLRPGAVIDAADCHLTVTRESVVVTRGSDRLSVPPIARLYQVPGGSLALLRGAPGGYELRVYQTK
jgi:hypothetical protein